MPIVYTGGTFDLFHSGHTSLLKRCKELSGIDGKVVVGLNSDEFVLRYKSKRPILSESERTELLLSCRFVDEVVLNVGDENSKPAIESCKANYIVIGSDWARKDYYAQMNFDQDWLDEMNIGLIYLPYTKNISTSEIKNRIL